MYKINWIAVIVYMVSSAIMLYAFIHVMDNLYMWYWKY
jgi:hypothetical protein